MSNVWVVRAGVGNTLVDDFRRLGVVAFGGADLGDLRSLGSREAILAKHEEVHPDEAPLARSGWAAQHWKILTEIQPDDVVLTPVKTSREIMLGVVSGPYDFAPDRIAEYPHIRPVEWKKTVSRDELGKRANASLGSTLTIFSFDDYSDQVDALLDGRPAPEEPARDQSVELHQLIEEFGATYLKATEGQRHLAFYESGRAAARANWALVQAAAKEGKDVTDLVLAKLLPHQDTEHNRDRGAWIHIAPAITKDIKLWFERSGWTKPEDWPAVATAILQFLEAALETPAKTRRAAMRFRALPCSKGIQAAFLSPILNALRPDDFLIVNSKSLKMHHWLRGRRGSPNLKYYTMMNKRLFDVIEQHRAELDAVAPGVRTGDILDCFCHWQVAVKNAAKPSRVATSRGRPASIDRSDPDSAAAVFRYLFPDDDHRRVCQTFLADALEHAHSLGAPRWSVTLNRSRIRLNVGRVLALGLKRDVIRIGLPRNIENAGLRSLQESSEAAGLDTTPPSAIYTLPLDAFLEHEQALREPFQRFLRAAAGTAKRVSSRTSYSPGIVGCLEGATDRTLPRPAHDASAVSEPGELPAARAIQTPRTVFKKTDYDLASLLSYIENGDIGLPDIQRPFVWSAAKVRDLFDSMYRGYPVGSLLFWENSEMLGTRSIDPEPRAQKVPGRLVVDGQQRLTSLYSVLKGRAVLDDDFKEKRIEIAFRPRDGKFEVADAAIRNDPEFVPDISELWTKGRSSFSVITTFLEKLEARRKLDDESREAISHNLDRLFDLSRYPFGALEIAPDVSDERVAEIFVRINSEGVKLQQADFILTLLSVFWEDGRADLERFARESRSAPARGGPPSPFNHLLQPDASQLLRVAIAVGFHRARLRSVYQVLRGKDVGTGQLLPDRREQQFDILKRAQAGVLDLENWHQYLDAITAAGFRHGGLISSKSALIYSYAFYLIGRLQCRGREHELGRLIGRWFFMVALTGRYTGSPETIMESDLNRIREVSDFEPFARILDKVIQDALPGDFWSITLPNDLEKSSLRNPGWYAYLASQNRLGVPVLFSDKRMAETMDPQRRRKRKLLEAHHLFPRAWLERNGYADKRQYNQIANFAHLEWPDNVRISDSPPSQYVPKLRERFSEATWERMCRDHALPADWEQMEYPEFLHARRALLAEVIRRGFLALDEQDADPDLHEDTATGTPTEREIWSEIHDLERSLRCLIRQKYTARWNQRADERIAIILGEKAWRIIERNKAKYLGQYRSQPAGEDLEILDFCYLGQLGQLMMASDAWEMFRCAFRDKRELEDMLSSILPVRNDSAHFRSVPERELTRCRLAIGDLKRVSSEAP